jgi:hypothetical protein
MSVTHSVTEILTEHVTLSVEGIDRMYLNVYVPRLQTDVGIASFFRFHRGHTFASSVLMAPISLAFVGAIEELADREGIPLRPFQKKEDKEVVAAEYRSGFQGEEGIYLIGKAQEKARVFRTQKRRDPQTGQSYPWIVSSTAMVNQYYFYCLDRDFGPFFLKFCSYFPYNAKLCLNGHEYAKQQLRHQGIDFEPLDNGVLSCADPKRLQRICDGLSAEKIDRLLRKWFRLLPHPFTGRDRQAGYRYDLSILQAEFSLTQVLDRPVQGRVFFEEVIRENLDLGRPDQVQLIFARRINRKTPGTFRTRVITDGVIPSLHVNYKSSRIKQYFKEGRALRVETTINNTRDFAIGKRLHNLPALREVGFQANRRLLDVQRISHDCAIGEDAFQQMVQPVAVEGQRASALHFDDPRVQALLNTVVLFALLPQGFASKDLREPLAHLLGIDPAKITQGRRTYDLRRLRLHGLIERIPHTHRYLLTAQGLRTAIFFSRVYARLLRPGLSLLQGRDPGGTSFAHPVFAKVEKSINDLCKQARLAA